MAPKRGRLNPEDEAKITLNYKFLTDELESKDLTPALFQEGVISRDDKEAIDCKLTRLDRATALVDQMLKSGPGDAYTQFVKALNTCGYEHVAEQLEDTDTSSQTRLSPKIDLPDDVLDKVLSDASASKVAFQIGSGWEHLMLQLGLTKVMIERAKSQSSGETMVITNLIIKWRQKEGKSATWKVFLDALLDLGDKITIEFDKIKDIAMKQK